MGRYTLLECCTGIRGNGRRRALPRATADTDGIATALMLSKDPLGDRMWSNQLSLVSMGSDASGTTARTLEVFLDYLVALATDNHFYLLADGYEQALSDAETAGLTIS